jgi:heme A synthase
MEKTCPQWIHYLAIGVTVLTWLLIILGGVVHGTGSSLACPDWPTCYGSFFPEMTGGIFFEHSHRLIAASVGLLTIALALGLWAKGPVELKKWGWIAVLLVIFQGVLGGLTVIYRLPPAVSIAHLGTSMLFFALLAGIVYKTKPEIPVSSREGSWKFLRVAVATTAFLIFFQVVLGALVRHAGAGLACLDFPFCQGALWPSDGGVPAKIQMIHRWGGVLVGLAVFGTAFQGWGVRKPMVRGLLILASLMVVVQILLGFFSITSGLGLIQVSAHLGVAALLWVTYVWLNLAL